ncbi:g2040 [Coccomyxa elongata]
MSERQRCCAASLCSNHEETIDSQGIYKRRGKGVRSGHVAGTDCGKVVCCEECREIHRLQCEGCEEASRVDRQIEMEEDSRREFCNRWSEAGGLLEDWRRFTGSLVTTLLICGFCGRGSFGGTPTSEVHFQFLKAVGEAAPPFLASNPFLMRYVGSFRRENGRTVWET